VVIFCGPATAIAPIDFPSKPLFNLRLQRLGKHFGIRCSVLARAHQVFFVQQYHSACYSPLFGRVHLVVAVEEEAAIRLRSSSAYLFPQVRHGLSQQQFRRYSNGQHEFFFPTRADLGNSARRHFDIGVASPRHTEQWAVNSVSDFIEHRGGELYFSVLGQLGKRVF